MTRRDSLGSILEHDRQPTYDASGPLLAGLMGGGLAVLVSKLFDLLASGLAGNGYQLAFPDKLFTALFILMLSAALFIGRRRPDDTSSLAKENHRRIDELLARIEKLNHTRKD